MSPIFRVNHMELVAMSLLWSWVTINGYYLARRSTRVYFQQRLSREFLLLLYVTNPQLLCELTLRGDKLSDVRLRNANYRSYCYQGSVGIYGTYEISILGRALINYVTSAISWNGFTASSVTQ